MPRDNSNRASRADASEGDKKLISLVLDHKDRFDKRRWVFEREWYRNILFYLGQQWITYEETYRRWRTRNMANWVPMPVTNRLASTTNVIRASVAQIHPAFVATPTRENEQSVLAANAADKYLDVIMAESGFRAACRRMASWVTLTGNAFFFTEFDTSEDTGLITIPGEICNDCGTQIRPDQINVNLACPNCGSTNLKEDPSASMDIPQGRLKTRCLSPFEVYADPLVTELADQNAILIVERRSLDDVKFTYPKTSEGLDGDTEREAGRHFLETLSFMTGSGFGSGMAIGNLTSQARENVTLYKLFVKRCEDYPDGVQVTMSGDQHILEVIEPYPHRYQKTGRAFFPVIHLRYDDVPGRFWAKTPIDDLVAKQRQRNEFESLFQTIAMRCANPVWLIPSGVQTSPITGDPSIQVRYTGAGGAKPERLQGVEVPASVLQFIQQIDQDFEELANTFAVLKGKNPGSVRAASAIQMLIERGFGRYGSVFDNLEEAYEQWGVQALEIWRQKAIFPRVQAVAQAAGAWQFMEFLGSDLGEVDLRVEAGSTRPKSQASRQMLVGQAMQWGLLNPNDPEQRMKIFEELGMVHLLPGSEADVKVVAEENAKFMAWAENAANTMNDPANKDLDPAGVLGILLNTFPFHGSMLLDHHPTHIVHHRRFAQTEKFRALPQPLRDLFVQHIVVEHMNAMLQEAATGMGATGLVLGMQQPQGGGGQESQASPGSNRPTKPGGPTTGKGPGGNTTNQDNFLMKRGGDPMGGPSPV